MGTSARGAIRTASSQVSTRHGKRDEISAPTYHSKRCPRVRACAEPVERAELVSIYVKLALPLSVDYVEVKGKDPSTGAALLERIKH